jgi:type I restriction enzyme M protein
MNINLPVTLLTPTTVDPELLLVYLRLPLVCELLDLHTTASMYPAISTTSLMKIPIALPDGALRQRIVAKVQESFQTRREAYRLMEEAKNMIDKAILGIH